MIRGLVGLSFLYSASGFTGPISTRPRPAGSSRSSGGTSFESPVRQQAPQPSKVWRSTKQHRPTYMTTGDGGDSAQVPASAPRLKRVRRRRKDGASVAIANEEEEAPAAAAADFESARAAAATTAQVVAAAPPAEVIPPPPPPPVAVQQSVQEEEEEQREEEEVPLSTGGTKGTKVRVVDSSDDDMGERLAEVAAVASGAAGDAASAVSGAAKSAIGAAMSALGQGPPLVDEFDIDSMPAGSERGKNRAGRRTTPGKTASELADLGADIERFRRAENRQPETAGESIASGAKNVISTIISIDFFVVIAFMLWFIAGVVSSYGFGNAFLLDQFNDKWTPVVQPALGVLMGGTIAGGVVSKLGESGDGGDDDRPPGSRGI